MFDGTPTDVRSLDYLAYEGFSRPVRGDSQAALVCGEVLRRMLGLHWVVSDSGGWFVASHGEATEVVICPLARLQELDVGGCPQFGRFGLWLTRALLDCQWLAAFTDLPTTLADAMDVDFLPGSADLIARLQRIATA